MKREKYTWKEAIEKVLKDAGKPLHRKEITERIKTQRLRASLGNNPDATVFSNLSKHTDLFEKLGDGAYQLQAHAPIGGNSPIRAIGRYWERDLVDWSKTKPKILGAKELSTESIDMTDQVGVYLLHDFSNIIYVGQTADTGLGNRLRSHTRNRLKTRWNRFSWFGFQPVRNDHIASTAIKYSNYGAEHVILAMEALLIEALEPPLNRRGGDGVQGIEYIQVEDPNMKYNREMKALIEKLLDNR